MSYAKEKIVIEKSHVERMEFKKLSDWIGNEFESDSVKTEEFVSFAKMFRSWIGKACSEAGLVIVEWSDGHFYCSCFVKNISTGKIAYLSIPDVRHFPDAWTDDILIRTAEHEKDYRGGTNRSATLANVGERLGELTAGA